MAEEEDHNRMKEGGKRRERREGDKAWRGRGERGGKEKGKKFICEN